MDLLRLVYFIYRKIVTFFCPDMTWYMLEVSRFDFYKHLYSKAKAKNEGGQSPYSYRSKWWKFTTVVVDDKDIIDVGNRAIMRPYTSYSPEDPITHTVFNTNNSDKWSQLRKPLSRIFGKFNNLEAVHACGLQVWASIEMGNPVDVVQISRQYVNKVLYQTVFGCTDPAGEEEFAKMSRDLRNSDSGKFHVPAWLKRLIATKSEYKHAADYFRNLVRQNKNNQVDSFLKLLVASCPDWDESMIVAHCTVFLTGGFTSTVTTIVFALYELAKNPAIQRQLREEINDCPTMKDRLDNSYLDCVVNEVLRKYSPFPAVLRQYEGGTISAIPVSGIHHDPSTYADPDKFMPERFFTKPSNRSKFLPFGIGKRKCLGEHFAILIIKTFVILVLTKSTLELPVDEPLVISPGKFTTTVSKMELIVREQQ